MAPTTDAAEMIAKLRVVGHQAFDEALKKAGEEVLGVGSKSKQAGAGIMDCNRHMGDSHSATVKMAAAFTLLSGGLGIAASAIRTVTGGFVDFLKASVEEASSIERIRLTFAALTGSLDTANQKMKFLKDYASGAISHFDDLAAAGKLLEAAGLNMERFIPTIDTLAGVSGKGSQAVMELAEAFSKVAGGEIGEAMRVFRDFGINAGAMAAQSTKAMQQAGGDAIAAKLLEILGVAKQKFGLFGQMMRDSTAVRFSSLLDAWKATLTKFGEAWFPLVRKITDSLTPFIDYLSESGEIGKIGEGISNAIGGLFGSNSGDGMQRGIALVMATLERLPDVISGVGNAIHSGTMALGQGIVNVYNAIGIGVANATNWMKESFVSAVNFYRLMAGQFVRAFENSGIFRLVNTLYAFGQAAASVVTVVAQKIGSALTTIAGQVAKFVGFIFPILGGLGKTFMGTFDTLIKKYDVLYQKFGLFPGLDSDALKKPLSAGDINPWLAKKETFNPADNFGDLFQGALKNLGLKGYTDSIGQRADEIMKGFGAFKPQSGNVDPSKFGLFSGNYIPQMAHNLAKIEEHTGAAVDMKRFALGGGDLGQMGVTPAEIYGRQHNIDVNVSGRAMEAALRDMVADMYLQMMKQSRGSAIGHRSGTAYDTYDRRG